MDPLEFLIKAKNRVNRIFLSRIDFLIKDKRERKFEQRLTQFEPGSLPWLVGTERHYGGYVSGVKRGKVSQHDPRTKAQLEQGGMIGGDRMTATHNSYAKAYANYLLPFARSKQRIVLVEVGILRGSGVAMWSDLFPDGRIIGMDIDLAHIKSNSGHLRSRGAFRNDNLELHEFDQLIDNRSLLSEILAGDQVDIYIDDGMHTETSILTSLRSIRPYLAENCVCLIEDNNQISTSLAREFPEFDLDCRGLLTVMTLPKKK